MVVVVAVVVGGGSALRGEVRVKLYGFRVKLGEIRTNKRSG